MAFLLLFLSLSARAETIRFEDITAHAGIHFVHNNGAFGKKYLPETLGSGVAFIDYDNDGWQDILLLNFCDWPNSPRRRDGTMKLYHNNGNGTFTDRSKVAGLARPICAMGVAIADYDNDGWDDIYITALDGDRLFHNEHNGTFKDVTAAAGIHNKNFGTSAAWLDYDRDGWLDLFVGNYVGWSPEKDLFCTLDGKTKSYCTPESYPGAAPKLYHNLRDGRFEDVTAKAGLNDPTNKALGVSIFDYNLDGWPDILVANDTQPNKLYRNNRDGTFTDIGVPAGIAFSEEGVARGAMGVDWADYDASGYPSVAIGNFSNQMIGLYHNEKNGLFIDEAPRSTIGRASLLTLAFGLFFFDYDLDGRPDLFVANGHIEDDIQRVQPLVSYRQPPHLFHNEGGHRFEEVTQFGGESFAAPKVARGAAYADIDNDGWLDIVVTTNGGPAYLYRNAGGLPHHALRMKLVGTKSNRSAIGTRVRLHAGTGWQWQTVKSGSSYCSQSELPLTFGLGESTLADRIEIEWPSGQRDTIENVRADQFLTIQEGSGIQSAKPLSRK